MNDCLAPNQQTKFFYLYIYVQGEDNMYKSIHVHKHYPRTIKHNQMIQILKLWNEWTKSIHLMPSITVTAQFLDVSMRTSWLSIQQISVDTKAVDSAFEGIK